MRIAARFRDMAKQCRRLAHAITPGDPAIRVLEAQALEWEARAAELEAAAAEHEDHCRAAAGEQR
jgi:hypothetical protein